MKKNFLEKHLKMKAPEWPYDETLSDWIADLFFIQSDLVGAIRSGTITEADLYELQSLIKKLRTVSITKEDDLKNLDYCKSYVEVLKKAVEYALVEERNC